MAAVAVAMMLDILASLVAYFFQIPPPGAGGAGGHYPADLYIVTGILYSWCWLPVGYALTRKKGS